MPGYGWFVLLAVIGICLAAFILCKKRNVTVLVTIYLFAAMVSYNGEALVLGLFNSYSYKPGVLPDYWAENVLGHILPNSTLWPATALLVITFSLKYRWILLISACYMLVDLLFTSLGIYLHNWWNIWLTGVAIFTYCSLTRIWVSKLNGQRSGILWYITLAYVLWTIIYTPTVPLLLMGKQHLSVGLFGNMFLDSAMSTFIYHGILSFVSIVFLHVLKKWYWKMVPFLLFIIDDIILTKTAHLLFNGGWNIFYLMLLQAACLGLFIVLEHKNSRKPFILPATTT